MNKPPTIQVVPSFRMSLEAYKKMEKELPNAAVSREDSPEVVASKLGVQLALKYIRDNYLV